MRSFSRFSHIRSVRARAAAFLACCILAAAQGALSARPANDREEWTISLPAEGRPGDCVPVIFTSPAPLEDARASIAGQDGKVIASARAFTVPANGTWRYCALVAIPNTAKSGPATISAKASRSIYPIESEAPFTVAPRAFTEETVVLDAANTAIKTDYGAERMKQIRALNEILFAFNTDAPRYSGPFRAPLDSLRRTAEFGDRRTWRYPGGKSETSVHFGVDFGVARGTPVFAAGDGLVVMAANRVSTGLTVVIEHNPGVYSLYYHMEALLASEGELVRAGTLIGRSGSTGLSTGPHLHWEFRVNGEAVSPDWFAGRILY